jgi:hypothetical protein
VDRLFDDTDAQVRFGHERQHLNGARPKIGLAMSGGGTKAAVFSHGVLDGFMMAESCRMWHRLHRVRGVRDTDQGSEPDRGSQAGL